MLHQVRAGRRSQGSAAPLSIPPFPAVSSISSSAASFNPMTPDTKPSLRFSCQGPQTSCSRRQPSLPAGPSEAGVNAKRHFVCARRTGHCNLRCGFSGQEQMEKGPLHSSAFPRFYSPPVTLSSFPAPNLIFLLLF